MAARFALALTVTFLVGSSAAAQSQVIVQDNFDQYADTAAFLQKWVPTTGLGTAALDVSDGNYLAGVLTTDPFSNPANFPGVQGQAVDHVGATASTPGQVNQWGGVIDQTSAQEPDFSIVPSETQNVRLKADIFVGASGNERMSVGLRSTVAIADGSDADTFPDANTSNIFEMGVYNAAPTVLGIAGTAQVSTGYAFRIINFGSASAPLTGQPNWQYFELPIELDRTTDADTVVNIGDIGAGWHSYTATFSPTEITVSIDLFRDGLRNTSITPDVETGIRPGAPGVDATITLPVATLPAGFNNLRIGGPSGLSSAGTGAMGFDNILLETQAVSAPANNADFNGDNIVDGADFLIWQRGFGTGNSLASGDANGDLVVDGLDLDVFKTQFGTDPTPAVAAVGAIPEPTTLALAGLAMVAGLAAVRRR